MLKLNLIYTKYKINTKNAFSVDVQVLYRDTLTTRSISQKICLYIYI